MGLDPHVDPPDALSELYAGPSMFAAEKVIRSGGMLVSNPSYSMPKDTQ